MGIPFKGNGHKAFDVDFKWIGPVLPWVCNEIKGKKGKSAKIFISRNFYYFLVKKKEREFSSRTFFKNILLSFFFFSKLSLSINN